MPVIFCAKLHYFYGISQPFRLFLVILQTYWNSIPMGYLLSHTILPKHRHNITQTS